jgi:predicted ATPase
MIEMREYDTTMLLRTLGGLELAGTSFTRPKPLLLLAYLALEGQQERRHVAKLFWPEAADHMKSLTVALTQLRQGAPGAIESDSQRCWVPLQTDAQEFLTKLEKGDLEAALEAYPAPFMRGFHLPELGIELEEWVLKTREYFAGRARQAMLSLAEKDAGQGQFATAAKRAEEAYTLSAAAEPEVEELVRIHPLLLAGDNPMAAEVRKELESLGHRVEWPGSPSAVRERLSRARLVRRQPPLPTRNTPFLGRKQEQEQLRDWLTEQRLISVVGPAGVGKTRLALQLAQELRAAEAFSGGVFFVDLEALENPEHLIAHIAANLPLEVNTNQEVFQALADGIADQTMLLVLDNFEHLIELAPHLSDLLRACPNLRIMTTSRERLGLEEEQVFHLASLRYPHDEAVLMEEAQRFYSVQLLVDRAKRAKADFEPHEEDIGALVQICRVVDGLPLGLELAAAWVRVMPLREIAAELSRNLDLLSSTARNVPERHKSIRTAFEYSWKLLTSKEQDVLRKLSVFRGGFRRESASEVAGATIPILASLVDKSFLRMDSSGRYHRHPLVYEFTGEKLAEVTDARTQTIQRHTTHFLRLLGAMKTEMYGPGQAVALGRFAEEVENIRLAWRWAAYEGQWNLLEEALETLRVYFDQANRHRERLELLQLAADAIETRPDPQAQALHGKLLADVAWSEHRLGHNDRAMALAAQATRMLPARSVGALRALNVAGSVAWKMGNHAEARAQWLEAYEAYEAQGHAVGIGRFSGNLAIVEQALGNLAEALRYAQRSLEIALGSGDHLNAAQNYNRLGDLEFDQHNLDSAHTLWSEGLAHAQQHGIEVVIPLLLHNLGRVATERGEFARARELFDQSLERARKADDPSLQSQTLTCLASMAMAEGALDDAAFYLRQSLELAHAIRSHPVFLGAAATLADLRLQQGRLETAKQLFQLVAQHPAAEQKDRERAEQMLQEIGGTEPEQAMSLEGVLESLGSRAVPDL